MLKHSTMNPDTTVFYKTVPVSEPPTVDGDYFVNAVSESGIDLFSAWVQFFDGKWHHDKWAKGISIGTWLKPCSLSEIIGDNILTTPQAISDLWFAAILKGLNPNNESVPDKATYLKEHFNINEEDIKC